MSRIRKLFTFVVLGLAFAGTASATIEGSKHDLRARDDIQLCVFCHAPHRANTDLEKTPLWNRRITDPNQFTPYTSPTMTQTCPTRPSAVSMLCLSCHDGTTGATNDFGAVSPTDQHNLINPPKTGGAINTGSDADGAACLACHPGGGELSVALTVMGGPDLSNDHPVSMPYPVSNANYNPAPDPLTGWSDVKLFEGRVECPTCHSVHDPANVPFLRKANGGSELCLTCHNK